MSDLENLIQSYTSGTLSRHDFVRRMLTLGVGIGFIETLVGSGVKRALAAPPPQPRPSRAPYIVLVVMDAFRTDYIDLAPMPNLQWLMNRGVTFPNAWVGQLESYTPASHATISTGATPAHHGVIGFDWRDPATGQETYTAWYNDVIAGRLEQQLQQHGVNSIPQAVKKQDPDARVVSMSSEKYYAADALGGFMADYIIYGLPQGSKIVTRGIPHHVPPDAFLNTPDLNRSWPLRYGQFDDLAMTMALESLRAFDPRVLMVNLPGADIYGHRVGGPATPDVMAKIIAAADRQLGRLFTTLKNRGILDQTIFIVTGDHGMVKNTHQIDDRTIKQAVREVGDYLFHTGGNSAYIWLKDPGMAPDVAQHLVNTLDYIPFAHYQSIDSGKYIYHPVYPDLSIEPNLEAAYQYLLGTFAGPLAPDIALGFEEDTITRIHSTPHGEHGGGTWGAQQIPMVVAGPGLRSGMRSRFPARLMDIAPTVLTLLGIQPGNMDGAVLADALAAPTKDQVAAQDAVASKLVAYQQAIINRSHADIAAQAAERKHGRRVEVRTSPADPSAEPDG